MAFNRDRNSRGGRFEMHKAICDKCGRECEVPFKPTQGKPVFCSNCFENQRGSEPRRFSTKSRPASGWEERRPDSSRDQFEALNQKLDKILQLLEAK